MKKYKIGVSLNELYVDANKTPPIRAGATSRNQVNWSLGFIPDHNKTIEKIIIQSSLIVWYS